jgi:hypothetical protein
MGIFEEIKSEINNSETIELFSYKEDNDFKKLWGFDPKLSNKTIVIVWDDIAGTKQKGETGSLVDTSKYLTPIDWAVGYSLSFYGEAKNVKEGIGEYPDLKILIVDSASDKASQSDSVKFVYQAPDKRIISMPWIGLYSKEKFEVGIGSLPSMKESYKEKAHDLDSIKRIWAASLTRPSTHGDHHAIANLVGPLLLMEEVGGDLHVNALQALMRSIGLLPDHKEGNASDENGEAMLCAKNPWVDVEEYNSDKLKLILIDDMFQISWGKILCRAVGLDYEKPFGDDEKDQLVEISKYDAGQDAKIVVKATSSAEWILERLESFDKKDNRFNFSLDNDCDSKEILFLDLRLYSGNFKKEVVFFEKLANFANQHFKKDANRNLPWPGITNDEIAEIQGWIENSDKKQEDPEYIKALTLLPRILALTDLSLPIVLFSSTGRRDITEKLKPYGNIITIFEKPRFSVDIPLDIALQTKRKFQNAMEISHMILQARQKCRAIIDAGSKVHNGIEDLSDKKYHVELFIDESYLEESHENTIFVGGLFAIYSADNVDDAREKADNFDNALVKAGVRYFDRLGVGENAAGVVMNKKDSCCDELTNAFGSCVHKPDHLFFVRLECTMGNGKVDNIFYPKSGDNLFRMTLNSIIEFFLSETIPALFPKKHEEVSVSIYAGTRVQPFYLDKESELNIIKYRTGFESFTPLKKDGNPIKHVLQTTNRDTLFPIISDILSHHNLERNMHRVVGITLPYTTGNVTVPVYFFCRGCKKNIKINKMFGFEQDENRKATGIKRGKLSCGCGNQSSFYPDYRAFHYVADEILNHVNDIKGESGYGKKIKLSDFGFDDKLEKVKDALIASRYLDMKDIVSSIVQVNLDNIGRHSITHFLLKRQAMLLNSITGSDFCRIAAKQASDDRVTEYQFTQFLCNRAKVKEKKKTNQTKKNKSHPTKGTQQEEKKLLVIKEIVKNEKKHLTQLVCTCKDDKTVTISKTQINKGMLHKAKEGDQVYAFIRDNEGALSGVKVELRKNT